MENGRPLSILSQWPTCSFASPTRLTGEPITPSGAPFSGRSGGLSGYDETLAEERLPNHHPLLLIFKGRGIGTTRLDDLRDGTGIVRLVAIAAPDRGQGHGRILNAKVEECARRLGIRVLLVNAAAAAEGFYIATGWRRLEGYLPLTLGRAGNCVLMQKKTTVL